MDFPECFFITFGLATVLFSCLVPRVSYGVSHSAASTFPTRPHGGKNNTWHSQETRPADRKIQGKIQQHYISGSLWCLWQHYLVVEICMIRQQACGSLWLVASGSNKRDALTAQEYIIEFVCHTDECSYLHWRQVAAFANTSVFSIPVLARHLSAPLKRGNAIGIWSSGSWNSTDGDLKVWRPRWNSARSETGWEEWNTLSRNHLLFKFRFVVPVEFIQVLHWTEDKTRDFDLRITIIHTVMFHYYNKSL